MDGHDVSVKWLQDDEDAMKEPIIVEQPNGLEMEMPPADTFTVDQVAELVGADTPVEVIGIVVSAVSVAFSKTGNRCCHAINLTWLDCWQMGTILQRPFRKGKDMQCNLP